MQPISPADRSVVRALRVCCWYISPMTCEASFMNKRVPGSMTRHKPRNRHQKRQIPNPVSPRTPEDASSVMCRFTDNRGKTLRSIESQCKRHACPSPSFILQARCQSICLPVKGKEMQETRARSSRVECSNKKGVVDTPGGIAVRLPVSGIGLPRSVQMRSSQWYTS